MLVSHRYRFIYLKTRKTAGTSVEAALEALAMPPGVNPRRFMHESDGPAIETDAGVVCARGWGGGGRGSVWSPHMRARTLKDQLPDEVWDGYLKVCNVRNPWDKTVSQFHFLYPNIKDEDLSSIVSTFRNWLLDGARLADDFEVFSIDGQVIVDHFIRYEHLNADFAALCEKVDTPVPHLKKLKGRFRGDKRIPYQDYYDDKTRDIVADAFSRDIELMGWTFESRA